MVVPLMPQGVEHRIPKSIAKCGIEVVVPLMPQGVEHEACIADAFARAGVVVPLMPQGVEHYERALAWFQAWLWSFR